MTHYSTDLEETIYADLQKEEQYFIGMVKSGKYDNYLSFCQVAGISTPQVPLRDLEMMIRIICSRV